MLYNININCGYSLVVESHASDLVARVRFSLPAPLSKIVAPDENIDKSTVKVDFFYFVEIFDCKEKSFVQNSYANVTNS